MAPMRINVREQVGILWEQYIFKSVDLGGAWLRAKHWMGNANQELAGESVNGSNSRAAVPNAKRCFGMSQLRLKRGYL